MLAHRATRRNRSYPILPTAGYHPYAFLEVNLWLKMPGDQYALVHAASGHGPAVAHLWPGPTPTST